MTGVQTCALPIWGSIPYDIKVWRDLSEGASVPELDRMAGDACKFLRSLFA